MVLLPGRGEGVRRLRLVPAPPQGLPRGGREGPAPVRAAREGRVTPRFLKPPWPCGTDDAAARGDAARARRRALPAQRVLREHPGGEQLRRDPDDLRAAVHVQPAMRVVRLDARGRGRGLPRGDRGGPRDGNPPPRRGPRPPPRAPAHLLDRRGGGAPRGGHPRGGPGGAGAPPATKPRPPAGAPAPRRGLRHICWTGGEPLLQGQSIAAAIGLLPANLVHTFETDGEVDLAPFDALVAGKREAGLAHYIMDVKCPGSGMKAVKAFENLMILRRGGGGGGGGRGRGGRGAAR